MSYVPHPVCSFRRNELPEEKKIVLVMTGVFPMFIITQIYENGYGDAPFVFLARFSKSSLDEVEYSSTFREGQSGGSLVFRYLLHH